MSNRPIRYAAHLRRELSALNASYVALEQVPHVISYREMPVVDSNDQNNLVVHFLGRIYSTVHAGPRMFRSLVLPKPKDTKLPAPNHNTVRTR